VQTQLAAVSGDPAFAADFVKRYIAGTDKIDYAALLLRAGFVLRKRAGPASLGQLRLVKGTSGLLVSASTLIGSPAYNAGLDLDDEMLSVAGTPLAAPEDLTKALAGHKPGDSVEIVFRRRGQEVHATATLAAPTQLELVPVEAAGAVLSPEQKLFREAWLGTKSK
jgi:predicted metalloprotease with PDZ domain